MSWVKDLLEEMGIHGRVSRQGRELEAKCPFHEDSRPSFYANLESGAWICHSGCGKGAFIDLLNRLQARPVGYEELAGKPVATKPMRPLEPGLASLARRGFTTDMLDRWKIVWNSDIGAIEIPCHWPNGDFLGYIWRMPDGSDGPKYRHPAGFPRAKVLFGLDHLEATFIKGKEVILTEGPLDAIWGQEAGFPSVATLGAAIADGQLALLMEHTSRVTLCYDNDGAGRVATEIAAVQLRRAGFWVFRITLPAQYKDIQEVPLDKLPRLMETRKHLCVNGSGLVHPRYQRWIQEQAFLGSHKPWKF